MAKVYLIEGPVGAGKSTYSLSLSKKLAAPHFNLDAWMVRLFRPDRPATDVMPWYAERKARCIEQIWDTALCTLAVGNDVILELGLIQKRDRYAMYQRIAESGYELCVYVLDAPLAERRQRVQQRNQQQGATFSMVVPDDVFEMASAMWEEPDSDECDQWPVVFI